MAVGFSSYQIARSGLTVSERGLFVTGHNIANSDTAGYVRQQAISETSPYQTVYGKNNKMFQYGLGADIQETRQIRNTFLDIIYRQENTALGYYETRSSAIEDIESILNDPMGDGLQQVMNQFWDSWQELSKAPESLTTRALVRERGQAVAYYFNQVGTQLDRLQNDLNSEIRVKVDELNSITRQIATLNQKIASEEIASDSANDYRDQRNLLLDKLSYICDAQANEMQDGQIDITLGGYILVTKGQSRGLYVKATSEYGNFYKPMLEGTEIEVNIKSGKLKGLLESRGEVSGLKGSCENGTPNEKVDITIAVDTSLDAGDLKKQISSYVDGLNKSGVDYNIRFVEMNNTSKVYKDTIYTTENINEFLTNLGSFDPTLFNGDKDFTDKAAKVTYTISNMNINSDTSDDVSLVRMATNSNMSNIPSSTNIVSDLKIKLNSMLNSMVREVNYLSSTGYTLDGQPGNDFFKAVDADYPMEMGNLTLSDNLTGDDGLNNIVASSIIAVGDNTIARRIANLRDLDLLADSSGQVSLDEYYRSIILDIGNQGSEAITAKKNQQTLVLSADEQRSAISGVGMDEELSNMMKYKFAYDASSKVLNVIDTMIDKIVNSMGVVGR